MRDVVIIGAGLFGSVCAHELSKHFNVVVIEKRNHVGGNCYTEIIDGIEVHKYGAHIFHTKCKDTWNYINQFDDFNTYVHKVYANVNDKIYPIPPNLLTFQMVFGDFDIPLSEHKKKILFDMFIKEYSEKQWGCLIDDIPDVLNRFKLRYNYNNDYFENQYQGIPVNGYNKIFENLLDQSNVILNTEFDYSKEYDDKIIIYTGMVDRLCNYKYGKLSYRSLKFKTEKINTKTFQHNSVINFPEKKYKFTRIIEHKHFNDNNSDITVITTEYPAHKGEPYYPINNKENKIKYDKYINHIRKHHKNIHIGGRLGMYRYIDMDTTIQLALKLSKELLNYEH